MSTESDYEVDFSLSESDLDLGEEEEKEREEEKGGKKKDKEKRKEREEEFVIEPPRRRPGEPREQYAYRSRLFTEIHLTGLYERAESEMYTNMLTNMKYLMAIPVDSDRVLLEKLTKKHNIDL
jgi:hypothetical protein